MSARALMSEDVRIVEIDMPYHEREGESKLRIAADGVRFFKTIVNTTLLFRPSRPFGLLGGACLLAAAVLMLSPTLFYLKHGKVLEWMIYRFVVSHLLGFSGCLLLCSGYLCSRLVAISLAVSPPRRSLQRFFRLFFSSPLFWATPIALAACGGILVLPSLLDLLATGKTYEHWSRFIAMSFLLSIAFVLVATKIIDHVLDLVSDRLDYLRPESP
jgi:hypothetical protein